MIQFRVRAKPVEGEDFILENFEARSDAEKYYDELQSENGSILETTPYDAVVVSLEEFVHGQWVYVSKRLVGLR